MSAEWDPPFGSVGETAAPPAPNPAPPQPVAQFVIEPWPEEERRKAAAEAGPLPTPRPPAIEVLMANELALGAIEEPRPLGPPAPPLPPLPRIVPPEPDWELEEKLAIARNKRERLEQARRVLAEEHALAEELPQSKPPPRREPS